MAVSRMECVQMHTLFHITVPHLCVLLLLDTVKKVYRVHGSALIVARVKFIIYTFIRATLTSVALWLPSLHWSPPGLMSGS